MKTKAADLLVDIDLNILEANKFFKKMAGDDVTNLKRVIAPSDLGTVTDLLAQGDAGEKNCACRLLVNGKEEWTALTLCVVDTGDERSVYHICIRLIKEMLDSLTILSEKVNDLEYNQAEISEKAVLDFGMQVFNKETITGMAKEAMRKSGKAGIYLCIIDIDNFKMVNDTYGHLYGDEVLARVATIIKDIVGKTGVLGRIGGDEMLLYFNSGLTHAELRIKLKSIREHVAASYVTADNERLVTVSMGVSKYPDDADNYDDIFTIADKMLYRAKEKGKNRYVIYTPELHGNVLAPETDTVAQAEKAVNKERFMQDVLQKFLVEQRFSYGYMLKSCAKAFQLDEIMVVFPGGSIFNKYEVVVDNLPRDLSFLYEDNLLNSFNEQQMLVINNTNNAANISQSLLKHMQDHTILAMMIYKAAYNGTEAFFLFSKKTCLTRSWEAKDILLLELFGKALELGIGDR